LLDEGRAEPVGPGGLGLGVCGPGCGMGGLLRGSRPGHWHALMSLSVWPGVRDG
jgi:hypothetical protein